MPQRMIFVLKLNTEIFSKFPPPVVLYPAGTLYTFRRYSAPDKRI